LSANWRNPALVLACAAIVLALGLGIRQSFGLFLPADADLGWKRNDFAFAIGVSTLVWGLAQPLFGAWADRSGAGRVVAAGGLLFAAGLGSMPLAATPLALTLSAGLMVGLGLAATGFGVILGVVGRAFGPERRSVALGIASSGASFGQFLALPLGPLLTSALGWQATLLVLAGIALATVPLALAMVERRASEAAPGDRRSLAETLRQARDHTGFRYLTAGFLVSGAQIAFILGHLPAYLLELRMTPAVGATALALIGVFSVAGCVVSGYLGERLSKKVLLSCIHVLRALLVALFLGFPVSPPTVYLFAAGIGFLWLGTVPLASGLLLHLFGARFACTLLGVLFLAYQLGGFAGMWLGGHSVGATSSFAPVWAGGMALGVVAALLNLLIDERPLAPAGTGEVRAGSRHAAPWWIGLAVLCPVLALLALRGYYAPSVLIDFANIKLCAHAAVTA
jgi:predicted MFS family arabinose efflux permease